MKLKVLLVSLCFYKLIVAQDVHLSQFNASPANLNPALVGVFNGDYRVVGNSKSQWVSIPVPYRTFSISGDMKLVLKSVVTPISFGILLNKDKAGDSEFGFGQAAVLISYRKKINKEGTQYLTVGTQLGMSGKSFNPNKLSFNDQYNGTVYDPNIASNESFNTTKINYFDAAVGVNWFYNIKQRTSLSIGTSIAHINNPSQSFFGNVGLRLKPRILPHITYKFKVNTGNDIISSAMFTRQGAYSELIAGASLKHYLHAKTNKVSAIYCGAHYRGKDAFIASAGLDYDNFTVGLSYDINSSNLATASQNKGGIEFSVIYIFQKFIPILAKRQACPVFM